MKPTLPFGSVHDEAAEERRWMLLELKTPAGNCRACGADRQRRPDITRNERVRGILDAGGLNDTGIFVSGGIDEETLAGFARKNAPIDGIGIGTNLVTSLDAPPLDCVYKLQEYAGLPRRKRSTRKATWPGRKQVWRRYDRDGRMIGGHFVN